MKMKMKMKMKIKMAMTIKIKIAMTKKEYRRSCYFSDYPITVIGTILLMMLFQEKSTKGDSIRHNKSKKDSTDKT